MKKSTVFGLILTLTLSLSSGYPNTAQAKEKTSETAKDMFDLWFENWEQKTEFPFGFHVLFNSGYQRSDLSPLNTPLQKQGYNTLGPDLWSSGGAMQLVAWHIIYEFDGQVAIHTPINNDDYQAMVVAGNTFFNVGYEFKPTKELRIYPLLGVGMSFLDLSFARRSRLPSFDEFVSNPGWNGTINNTMFALNMGMGLEFQSWLGTLGLRTGYIFHPIGSSWWSNGSSNSNNTQNNSNPMLLSNGPEMALNGPYLKLVMGF